VGRKSISKIKVEAKELVPLLIITKIAYPITPLSITRSISTYNIIPILLLKYIEHPLHR
jgi:hypothetical protein